MECTVRILRERKQLGHFPGEEDRTAVKLYCPVLGEIVLSGEQAQKAVEHIRKRTKDPK